MKKKTRFLTSSAIGFMLSACIIVSGVLGVSKTSAAEQYTVNTTEKLQTIDGWGTSLIWWAGQVGKYDWAADDGSEVREQILELIYGKDGLEYNIARYNVPGGENPDCENGSHMQQGREMEGFKATEDSEYDWTADAAQRWVLDWINSNVEEPVIEYFSNSPPWWMTESGCVSGAPNGYENLKITNDTTAEYEEKFAVYFVDVLERLIKVDNIDIEYINPFNESTSTWWKKGGSQEGCYFTDEQRAEILYYVAELLDERGLDVKITFDDSTGAKLAYQAYEKLLSLNKTKNGRYDNVLSKIGKLNYHLYDTTGGVGSQSYVTRYAVEGDMKSWMSEMGYSLEDGNDTVPMTTAFKHSTEIRNALVGANSQAYVLWQVIEELSSQLGTTSNYGPIKVSYNSAEQVPALGNNSYDIGSYTIDKQYYVLGQYSKYIKAGYSIVTTTDENAVVAISPDGKQLVIVHENNSSEAADISYSLGQSVISSGTAIVTDKTSNWSKKSLPATGTGFSYTVTPYSVTTFVLNISQSDYQGVFVDDSAATKCDTVPTVEEIKTEEYAFNRFYLSSAWSGINGDVNTSSMYGSTSYAGTGASAIIKFNGSGIDVRAKMKSDSATAVSFTIDDGTPQIVDTSRAALMHGTSFKAENLTSGVHTLKIEVAGGYFNLDGAFILSGVSEEKTMPILGATSIINDKMYISFTQASENAVVRYRSAGGTWVDYDVTESGEDGEYFVTVENLTEAEYEVYIVDGDKLSETKVVLNTSTGRNLLYYVDAGAVDAGNYTRFERAGRYNTFKDGSFGVDPVTGKQWGMESIGNEKYAMGIAESPYRSIGDCVSADNSVNKAIIYKFEVDSGEHVDIMLTMFNSWSARTAKISINGSPIGAFPITANYEHFIVLKDFVADTDGFITIEITPEAGDNPLLGTVLIATNGTKAAAYATAAPLTKVTLTGCSSKASMFRIAKLENVYDEPLELEKAYVYYTDGTSELKDAEYDSVNITNTSPNTDAAIVTGSVDGLYFRNVLTLTQDTQTYYYIDCGTDGTDTVPTGSLHTEHDQQSTDDSTWGWMEGKDTAWTSDAYSTSIRYTNTKQLRYRLTELPAGKELDVTVASHGVWGWGNRSFDVYVNTDGDYESYSDTAAETENPEYIGTISIGNGTVGLATGSIIVPESGTIYIVAYNRASNQHPQISHIIVQDKADDAPARPTVNKTEARADDKIVVGNLTVGDLVVMNDESGRYIDSFKATASVMEINFADYDLSDCLAVVINTRHNGSLADSGTVLVSLPSVIVSGVREGWSNRNVLRFLPTVGVNVQKMVVVSPTGKKTDVSGREYYHYVATENGEYAVEITTRSNNTYIRKFDINNIDTITINAVKSTNSWTNGNVKVTVTLDYLQSALKEFYIDGVAQGIKKIYEIEATENGIYLLKAESVVGNEFVYELEIANIDKGGVDIAVNPVFAFNGGFKANLVVNGISGGVFSLKKGDVAFDCTNGLTLVEEGEYVVSFTSGTGLSKTFKVNLAYNTANLKYTSVSIVDKTLYATGLPGAVCKVYNAVSGEEVSAVNNGYEMSEGNSYLVYAEANGNYEVFSVYVDAANESVEQNDTGCSSVVSAGLMNGILSAVVLVLLAFIFLKKGGKRV